MLEFRDMNFELRDIDSTTGEFEGIISTPSVDSYGTIFETKAFKKTAKETRGEVVILWNHDPNYPLGLSSTIEVQEDAVLTRGMVDLSIDLGQRVLSGMKKKYITDLSIGFKRVKDKWDKIRNAVVITEVRLTEYSILPRGFASNPDASVTSVRSIPAMINSLRSSHNIDQKLLKDAIDSLQALIVEPEHSTQQAEPEHSTRTAEVETMLLEIENYKKRWKI